MTFVPSCRATPCTAQFVVPAAVPLPPRLLAQVTCDTPPASVLVPDSASVRAVVEKLPLALGVRNDTVGASLSVRVTVTTSLPMRPALSRAVMVMMLEPVRSGMPATDQLVVPAAMPEPPRLFDQAT